MATKFRIFVCTAEGKEFVAFTWGRVGAPGIAQAIAIAKRESLSAGLKVVAVWAEAIA